MMEENQLFSNKALTALLWPLLVEQLLSVLVGMADVLMVAALGETAVSGVSLVDSVNNLIVNIFFALASGGMVVCSRFIGADDLNNARRSSGQLVYVATLSSVAVMAVFLIGGRGFLRLLFGTVEAEVMDNAVVYMRLTCLSFPFLALYNAGFALFRSAGNSKISMKISLYMNVLNIAGNALCVFVLKMGVSGVAVPTLISRAMAAALTLTLLQRSGESVNITGFKDLKPNRGIIREILSIGIPNSIESGVFQFGKLTLQSLVSTLGTASIAGYAVACNLVTYLYLPGNAIGICMMTVVGQCVGAGYQRQAKEYAKKLLAINYAILAAMSAVCIAFHHTFVGMYNLSASAAIIAEKLFLAHTVAMVMWPLGFLLPYYFRANNQSKFTMVVAISSMWLFRIGFGYIFVKYLRTGVLGVWYAMFIDWFFRLVVFSARFFGSKKNDKIGQTSFSGRH